MSLSLFYDVILRQKLDWASARLVEDDKPNPHIEISLFKGYLVQSSLEYWLMVL